MIAQVVVAAVLIRMVVCAVTCVVASPAWGKQALAFALAAGVVAVTRLNVVAGAGFRLGGESAELQLTAAVVWVAAMVTHDILKAVKGKSSRRG
ncbi:MAG: hypothetical protein Q8N51_17585 [Gammaproteobacteria bacterium]|nr:hypothetical protein [Gammaproteobacteria bacterium]